MKKYFLWIVFLCLGQLHSNENSYPKTAILTCSDLRISPSQIFLAPMGDFYLVQSSGNVLNDLNRASLEFGIEIFNISNLIILSHNNCKAVQGAVQTVFEHIPANPKSMSIVYSKIEPSLKILADEKQADSMQNIDRAAKENALSQMKSLIKSSKLIQQKMRKSTLKATAAFFDQKTGQVEFLDL